MKHILHRTSGTIIYNDDSSSLGGTLSSPSDEEYSMEHTPHGANTPIMQWKHPQMPGIRDSPYLPSSSWSGVPRVIPHEHTPPKKTYTDSLMTSPPWSPSPSSFSNEETADLINQEPELFEFVATIVIQTFSRRYLAGRHLVKCYTAIRVLQRFVRYHQSLVMDFYDNATRTIQSAFRGWRVWSDLILDQYYAHVIQKTVRSYLCSLYFKYDLECITISQSIVRRFLVCKVLSNARVIRHKESSYITAATIIQKQWRSYDAQLELSCDITAATIIQGRWRSYDAQLEFMHTLADILIVQSVCRRFMVRHSHVPRKMTQTMGPTTVGFEPMSPEPSKCDEIMRRHKKHSLGVTKELSSLWRTWGDRDKILEPTKSVVRNEGHLNVQEQRKGRHPRRYFLTLSDRVCM